MPRPHSLSVPSEGCAWPIQLGAFPSRSLYIEHRHLLRQNPVIFITCSLEHISAFQKSHRVGQPVRTCQPASAVCGRSSRYSALFLDDILNHTKGLKQTEGEFCMLWALTRAINSCLIPNVTSRDADSQEQPQNLKVMVYWHRYVNTPISLSPTHIRWYQIRSFTVAWKERLALGSPGSTKGDVNKN